MQDRVLEVLKNSAQLTLEKSRELKFSLRVIVPLFCLFASQAHALAAPSPYVIKPPASLNKGNDRRRLAPLQVAQVVRAPAWIVMDADSGRVLKEYSSRRRMFPASTTKTLTALTALRHSKLTNVVRIGPNPPKVGEQSAYLLEGEKLTLADLLRAAMIKSANDACVAIAEGVGGDVPTFARLMNAEARRAGALNSNFVNPNGLHDPNHYTTAYDLARISRTALTSPFFNDIIRRREAEIQGNWKIGGNRLLVNKNRLLWLWNEADGVKTGYTRQAGRCLVASAARRVRDSDGKWRNWRLISVVLHSPDVSGESARLLLDGFRYFKPSPVAQKGQTFKEISLEGGARSTTAVALRDMELPLRSGERVLDFDGSSGNAAALTRRVRLEKLQAPLKRGQNVGRVEWLSGKNVVAQVPLVAKDDVPVAIAARVMPLHLAPSDTTLLWLCLSAIVLGSALLVMRRVRT